MEKRPSKHEYFLALAKVVATRSTCVRRQVGCVLTDVHANILATGYNGVARGLPHCSDSPCIGSTSKSGSDLDVCEAIHAEQNALLQCCDVNKIRICYVTCSPCLHCLKMLLNTSCELIVYSDIYVPHFDEVSRLWCSVAVRRMYRCDAWPVLLGDDVIRLVDKAVVGS